ncbi:hypothetical protein RRG08_012944 [Elysia crispata]|uniref:Uncharacterized protein n=1 Tax=Elysia crispata TaxID=231223 RepID=A0AAE0ZZX4_9GAST|nr:hypothetical protein RRG08_012944 [Elysia crispata]
MTSESRQSTDNIRAARLCFNSSSILGIRLDQQVSRDNSTSHTGPGKGLEYFKYRGMRALFEPRRLLENNSPTTLISCSLIIDYEPGRKYLNEHTTVAVPVSHEPFDFSAGIGGGGGDGEDEDRFALTT